MQAQPDVVAEAIAQRVDHARSELHRGHARRRRLVRHRRPGRVDLDAETARPDPRRDAEAVDVRAVVRRQRRAEPSAETDEVARGRDVDGAVRERDRSRRVLRQGGAARRRGRVDHGRRRRSLRERRRQPLVHRRAPRQPAHALVILADAVGGIRPRDLDPRADVTRDFEHGAAPWPMIGLATLGDVRTAAASTPTVNAALCVCAKSGDCVTRIAMTAAVRRSISTPPGRPDRRSCGRDPPVPSAERDRNPNKSARSGRSGVRSKPRPGTFLCEGLGPSDSDWLARGGPDAPLRSPGSLLAARSRGYWDRWRYAETSPKRWRWRARRVARLRRSLAQLAPPDCS